MLKSKNFLMKQTSKLNTNYINCITNFINKNYFKNFIKRLSNTSLNRSR